MRKYIVLHHEDMSPSILCIDRIKEISELPGWLKWKEDLEKERERRTDGNQHKD